MIDPSAIKLGKKLGVVHDRRTFAAKTILSPDELPKIPIQHRIARNLHQVPVFLNDDIGDCTQASKGHAIISFENSAQQREIQLTDEDIVAAYQRVGGYIPGRPETDQGAYELDSLNDWRHNGLGKEKDGTPHTIFAYVKVNERDLDEVRRAHYTFGGLKVCAGLPNSAADQLTRGLDWTLTSGPSGEFGSWGGHSMYSPAYDEDGLTVFTWGEQQWMSWDWWLTYVDEVYAVISEDYIRRRSGKTPQGFNLSTLERLLQAL